MIKKTAWDALKEMASSKKFIALVGAMIAWMIAKAGFDVDQESLDKFLAMVTAYILSQAYVDNAKTTADATKESTKLQVEGGLAIQTAITANTNASTALKEAVEEKGAAA